MSDPDQITFRVGNFLEAQARGRFAVATLFLAIVVAASAAVVGRGFGWW